MSYIDKLCPPHQHVEPWISRFSFLFFLSFFFFFYPAKILVVLAFAEEMQMCTKIQKLAIQNSSESGFPGKTNDLSVIGQSRSFRFCLTVHNWQEWKSRFLKCHYHEIYKEEAVGLKSSNYTLKNMIFVNMWNLGQFR